MTARPKLRWMALPIAVGLDVTCGISISTQQQHR
jgi:hypothetical protein